MNKQMRADAETIVSKSIQAVLPEEAVRNALRGREFTGRVILVSVGKAAWKMAQSAMACLPDRIEKGIVISKYGHIEGEIEKLQCMEAGHPVPDENSYAATQAAISLVENLRKEDTVLFLLSGGGSALFERPLIPPEQLQEITDQLLKCGASIVEINTIRKRLSGVKGGRFAGICAPAKVFAVVLSDIIGDPLDMIASGPVSPDSSTCEDAEVVVKKYDLRLSEEAKACLRVETPKVIDNVTTTITGSVRQLCIAAADSCRELGYRPILLTDRLCCQAKEAGSFLASILRSHSESSESLAFIAGGETVVHVRGTGVGGRNQELALGAAGILSGMKNAAVFSVGSDGTDGPTDAAGGYADEFTASELEAAGLSLDEILRDNDAYNGLKCTGGLIFTGPTGTNVNDVSVALLKRTHISI
jgi:hydroxypyruvate reductase